MPLIIAALGYHAIFIWKTSFLIGTVRYFSLFDDAMVSMRFARNLTHGHGLVWNPGEPPVEGFSNPLWTLVMAAVHALPLPAHRMSLAIQALGAIILVALMCVVHRLAGRLSEVGSPDATAGAQARGAPESVATPPPPRGLPFAATALTAFYYPLSYWTLQGMEVGLLALVAAAAALMLLSRRSLVGMYLLLAVGTFVRLDFVVVLLAFAVAGAVLEPSRRTRHLIMGFATALLAPGIQTLARGAYFHALLPNTYHLKLTGYPVGLRLTRGAWVLLETVMSSRGLLLLLPLAGIWLARGGSRLRLAALLLPALAVCAYSVWVGGDAWEGTLSCNRYLAVAMPLLLVVAAWPLAGLAARLAGSGSRSKGLLAALSLGAVLAIAPCRTTVFLDPPPYVRENAELTSRAVAARGLTLDGASVAAAAVGAVGYYSERRIVDLLGKNDPHIARLPMRRGTAPNALTAFYPGHLKWDYAYSIGRLRPDVVAQLWWYPREADSVLKRDYDMVDVVINERRFSFAVRRGSPQVRWSE